MPSSQLYMGNIPAGMEEGAVIEWLRTLGLPVPYKVLVRQSTGSFQQQRFGIASWFSAADAETLIGKVVLA